MNTRHQQADQIEALTAAIQRLGAQLISGSVLWDHREVYVGGVVPLRNRHLGPTTLLICYNSSDLRAYEKFEQKRKVKIWELHAKHFMTEAEIALTLYTSKGEGEQELEFVVITTIYRRGGVDTILSLLRQAFRQKAVAPEQQRLILVGSGQSLFFDAIKAALDVAIS